MHFPAHDFPKRAPETVSDQQAVFLFGILGMGAGPSELGKSAREIWKLGKVEMCFKALKVLNPCPKTLQN